MPIHILFDEKKNAYARSTSFNIIQFQTRPYAYKQVVYTCSMNWKPGSVVIRIFPSWRIMVGVHIAYAFVLRLNSYEEQNPNPGQE